MTKKIIPQIPLTNFLDPDFFVKEALKSIPKDIKLYEEQLITFSDGSTIPYYVVEKNRLRIKAFLIVDISKYLKKSYDSVKHTFRSTRKQVLVDINGNDFPYLENKIHYEKVAREKFSPTNISPKTREDPYLIYLNGMPLLLSSMQKRFSGLLLRRFNDLIFDLIEQEQRKRLLIEEKNNLLLSDSSSIHPQTSDYLAEYNQVSSTIDGDILASPFEQGWNWIFKLARDRIGKGRVTKGKEYYWNDKYSKKDLKINKGEKFKLSPDRYHLYIWPPVVIEIVSYESIKNWSWKEDRYRELYKEHGIQLIALWKDGFRDEQNALKLILSLFDQANNGGGVFFISDRIHEKLGGN